MDFFFKSKKSKKIWKALADEKTYLSAQLQPDLNGALFCHCGCCSALQIACFLRNGKKSGSGRRIQLPKPNIVDLPCQMILITYFYKKITAWTYL